MYTLPVAADSKMLLNLTGKVLMHNEMDATAWSPQPYPPLQAEYFEILKKLIETIDSASLLLEGNTA